MSYTKLHSSIVDSTVWRLPHPTRIVWITLLAKCDRDGCVQMSLPGLSDASRVTLQEAKEAIATFQEPDEYSSTPDNEGRRIESIPGGWRILNYDLYRAKLSQEDQKASAAERNARYRERLRQKTVTNTPKEMPRDGARRRETPRDGEGWKMTLSDTKAKAKAEVSSLRSETHTVSRFESSLAEPALPIACVPPKPNGNGGFVPDCERFATAYPEPVNDLAMQYFCQIVKTCVIQESLFKSLEAHKATDKWKRGIGIKAAKNWLSEGDYKLFPKTQQEIVNELNPPAPQPPDWQTPAKPAQRTIADVLEDMRFQQQFKRDNPKLAAVAQERLLELESELRWLEVGEPQPENPKRGTIPEAAGVQDRSEAIA